MVPIAYIIFNKTSSTALCVSVWTHCTWSPGKWVSCPGWLWTWTYCCGAWCRWLRWGEESDPQPPDPRSDNSRRTETCLSCTDGPSDSRCSEWPVGEHGHTHICIILHCICDHLYAILYQCILRLGLHMHQNLYIWHCYCFKIWCLSGTISLNLYYTMKEDILKSAYNEYILMQLWRHLLNTTHKKGMKL